jgi:putative ABC transport system permease protein
MFENYFKTAVRNLFRNKKYSLINISGLAVGISVCLVIFIILQFELSFDQFHQKKDRIYRVVSEFHQSGKSGVSYAAGVPAPLLYTLRTDFPQLEQTTGIFEAENQQVVVLDDNGQITKKFAEKKGVFYAEPSFFSMFDFPWLAGDPATALKEPASVVLTKEVADTYFGDWKQAMGKSIRINDQNLVKVAGVLAPIPPNTDFQFRLILSYNSLGFQKSTDFSSINNDNMCFVLLPPMMSAASFDAQLRANANKYRPADNKDVRTIQPLSQLHYQAADRQISNYSGKTIDPAMVRTLWLIAVFILLIACVNFINLSTAQAVNRAKEIGVRKVLGSNKWQLKVQFILETVVIVIAAAFIALYLAYFALGSLRTVLALPLTGAMLFKPVIFLYLLIIIILVTVLAGFYPAIVLSGFNPVTALKNKQAAKAVKGISLRRGLVVFQFAVAQVLIIGTVVMVKQMDYFRTGSMGFDQEAVVNIPFPTDSLSVTRLGYMRDRLQRLNGVQHVTMCSNGPADEHYFLVPYAYDNAAKEAKEFALYKFTDSDYLKTYNLELAAGRNFQRSDSISEFIINAQFVKQLGETDPNNVLNKKMVIAGGGLKGRIVGVVKDFHATSFKDKINPVLFINLPGNFRMVGVKLATADIPTTMKEIQKIWSDLFPSYVFDYQFLNDKIAAFYKRESQLAHLYKIFAAIAVFLSCLGLYGLVSFMAVQRIREVAIRKVMGATSFNIIYLFSKEFLILVGIAYVIASPLAWYFMNNWLEDYAFRINISWQIFIIGALTSLITALGTVSLQAVKASLTPPARNLQSE